MKTFNGLNPDFFLNNHWQKNPAFFPNGLSDHSQTIDETWFFKLASDKRLVSRLVHAGPRFLVEYGPFPFRRFNRLPDKNWTLLISETDRLSRDIHDLKKLVSFIPSWRLDDVMISYGVPGGSVGPHIDEYDVFLLQVGGEKRWRITTAPIPYPQFRQGEDLRILKHFSPDKEYVCKSGDVLYLPPGVGHEGVTVKSGFTVSIGFRAPSLKEGLPILADLLINTSADMRFTDAERPVSPDNHLLSQADQDRLRSLIVNFATTEAYRHWMGSVLTGSKRGFSYRKQKLANRNELRLGKAEWSPGVRRVLLDGQPPILYIEGIHFPITEPNLISALISEEVPSIQILENCLKDPILEKLIINLFRNGWLLVTQI